MKPITSDCTGDEVLVLRRTQKPWTRLGVEAIEQPRRSKTVLGDWYVKTLTTRKHRLLFFASETKFRAYVE